MSLIESEIKNWTPVSYSQRELLEETKALLAFDGFIPPTFYCRTHHIYTLTEIAQYWTKAGLSSPWKLMHKPEFLNSLHILACIHIRDDIAFHKTDPGTYMEDVIGNTPQEIKNTRRSWYLYAVNFLLRTACYPTSRVIFNKEMDRICYGCKGGVEGAGKHCRDIAPDRFDRDYSDNDYASKLNGLMTNGEFAIERISWGIVNASFSIPHQTLFNPSFIRALEKDMDLSLLPWLSSKVKRNK